jgi:hypothetical protein
MSVRIATVELEGVSPYSQSRYHETEKEDQESYDAYRKRTWREHLHYDPQTKEVFIPPMSIKNALTLAAGRLGMKVLCARMDCRPRWVTTLSRTDSFIFASRRDFCAQHLNARKSHRERR